MKKNTLLIFLFSVLLSGCILNSNSQNNSQNSSNSPDLYIENKGSDTIVNMALAWAEEYQTLNSNLRISVTGGGSGTGIAALINNTVDLANASRQIKQKELENAAENGVTPIEFIVARDAIAVIVNPDNPINQLTLQQISDIFSGKYTNWNELGGDDRPIVKLSRETNSGTHVYFLEEVVRQGNKEDQTLFSQDTLLLPSSEGIISEVTSNPNAIGYDGLGYITDEVKVIAVAITSDDDFVFPSIATVNNNTYPIARNLYMYTNGEPTGHIKEYLNWIFSKEAQLIVSKLGFVPIVSDHK